MIQPLQSRQSHPEYSARGTPLVGGSGGGYLETTMTTHPVHTILELLRDHPDANRKSSDSDPARTNGLQQLQCCADGSVAVLWHWGAVRFTGDVKGQAAFAQYLTRV